MLISSSFVPCSTVATRLSAKISPLSTVLPITLTVSNCFVTFILISESLSVLLYTVLVPSTGSIAVYVTSNSLSVLLLSTFLSYTAFSSEAFNPFVTVSVFPLALVKIALIPSKEIVCPSI